MGVTSSVYSQEGQAWGRYGWIVERVPFPTDLEYTTALGYLQWPWPEETGATYAPHGNTSRLSPELTHPFYHATLTLHFSLFFGEKKLLVSSSPWEWGGHGGQLKGMTCIPRDRPALTPCQQISDLPNHACKKRCRFGQIHPTFDTLIQLCVTLASTFIMLISSKVTL